MPRLDLVFERVDQLVQLLEVLGQARDESAERSGQLVARVFKQLGDLLGDVADALRDDQAELAEQAANLVGLGRAGYDKALARSMQRQHRLLLDALHWNESHAGPGDGLADGFRISHVVLVALHIGLDELRRHQAHRMAEALQARAQ